MKKIHCLKTIPLFTALFFLLSPATSPAAETYAWHEKLARGLLNVAGAGFEIPREIYYTSDQKGWIYGYTYGAGMGLSKGFLRLGTGLLETLTFHSDYPRSGKKPLLNPEFPWQRHPTAKIQYKKVS